MPSKRLEKDSPEEKRILRFALVLCAVFVILDQVTKFIIVAKLPIGKSITVIPEFFNITHVLNRGAAFGIMQGKGWALLIISIVAFAGATYFFRALTEGWKERYFALLMIMSGILGNSIDRIWRHEVVDFLDVYISERSFPGFAAWVSDLTIFGWRVFGSNHWPAFNIADSAITVGVIIFFVSSLLRPEKDAEAKEDKKIEPESNNEEKLQENA